MSEIRIYSPTEVEYEKLNAFCDYMNERSQKDYNGRFCFYLEDIYFDYGQGWKYTGVITKDTIANGLLATWQTVCPRDYSKILNSTIETKEQVFEEVADYVFKSSSYQHNDQTKQMAIIITPNEEVKCVEYVGYQTIRDGVNGVISFLSEKEMDLPNYHNQKVVAYCNDEFPIDNSEEFDTVNAVATALYGNGNVIYGNVVLVKQEMNCYRELDDCGFDARYVDGKESYSLCKTMCNQLNMFIKNNAEMLRLMHEEFDKNKPEPYMEFATFDTLESVLGKE